MKNRSIRARRLAPALTFLSLTMAASVQSQVVEMNPVVVSAARFEQKLSDVIPSATVISREEIQRTQAPTLVDLLQGQPGLEIGRNGGPGSVSSVFMRGQNSNNVAVFIDGIPHQRDSFGGLKLIDIPPSQIERIEILRGNMGAIYGESAVGGVINIYTVDGALSSGSTASLSYGSRNTSDLAAGYNLKGQDYRLGISLQRFKTDGFSAMNPGQNPARVNPDKDGLERESILLNGEKIVSQNFALGFQANKLNSEVDYDADYYDPDGDYGNDASPSDIQNTVQISSDVTVYGKLNASADWSMRLAFTDSKFKNSDFYNRNPTGFFEGKQSRIGWNNVYRIGKNRATFGAESTNADFENYGNYKRETLSAYLGYSGQVGLLDYQANVRRDEIKDKSNAAGLKASADTWLLGMSYLITDSTKITGLVSTAFRAPSVYEFGNTPSLKPESNKGTELGISHSANLGTFKLVRFDSEAKNAISYTGAWPCASNCYENIDRFENRGIDFSLTGAAAGWGYKFSAVKQDPKSDGTRPARRANEYASVELSKRAIGVDWSSKIIWSGNRIDVGNKTLESYTVVNLTASKQFSPEWTGRLKVENVFDEKYQLVHGYNTPPRGLFVTFQYQPK